MAQQFMPAFELSDPSDYRNRCIDEFVNLIMADEKDHVMFANDGKHVMSVSGDVIRVRETSPDASPAQGPLVAYSEMGSDLEQSLWEFLGDYIVT